MKLPKLKKINKAGLSIHLGKSFILNLPEDSSLIKNIPKLTDLAMNRENNFQEQNKLQIELQHLSDLLLEIETKTRKEKKS